MKNLTRQVGWASGTLLVVLLVLPLLALFAAGSPAALAAALRSTALSQALVVSLKTSLMSLLLVVIGGTPLAWWLSRQQEGWLSKLPAFALRLPVLLPPAVMGFALLSAFGVQGMVGGVLASFGLQVAFTTAAVVLAQTVVAVPFFVQAAQLGFVKIDENVLLAARTLGANPQRTFTHVLVPMALPALITGAAMAWARALGEFGATLFFAGNVPSRTQTMPLAIYAALESDIDVARAMALVLVLLAFLGLAVGRAAVVLLQRRWQACGR